MYCIYQITNKKNGKRYIGQHKYTDDTNPMGRYKGSGKLLWKAYNKYGFENFEIKVLYRRIRDKSTVDAMEMWSIALYKPEYNIAKGGEGGGHDGYITPNYVKDKISTSLLGHSCSEETKMRISESRKGKPHPHKGNKGRVVTKEARDKISKTLQGRHLSEETRQKLSDSHKGKTVSWTGKKRGPYKKKVKE